jgi:hypothetical protein
VSVTVHVVMVTMVAHSHPAPNLRSRNVTNHPASNRADWSTTSRPEPAPNAASFSRSPADAAVKVHALAMIKALTTIKAFTKFPFPAATEQTTHEWNKGSIPRLAVSSHRTAESREQRETDCDKHV